MVLDFFTKNRIKTREENFLILDIGTKAVKVLLGRKEKMMKKPFSEEKNTILAGSLKCFGGDSYSWNGSLDGLAIKKETQEALKEAIHKFCFGDPKAKNRNFTQDFKKWPALINLPASVFKARVIRHNYLRKEVGVKISAEEEHAVKVQVLSEVRKKVADNFAEEFCIMPQDVHWVSCRFLKIKIDGYDVSSLQGYAGKSLEFKILASFLPRNYFDNATRFLKELGIEQYQIVHTAENLVKMALGGKKDGIFLDIGGEVTVIFMVSRGEVEQISELETGAESFSRTIAETYGIDEESARILKEQHSNKILSAPVSRRIKDVLRNPLNIWLKNLRNKMDKAQPKSFFQSNFFIFGGGALTPGLEEVLENSSIVLPQNLLDIEDSMGSLKSPQNTPALLNCYHK